MRKMCIGVVMALAMALAPAASFGAGNDHSGPTVGDCISDGFYGNEPNIVDPFAPGGPQEQAPGSAAGRVVPSQSPGPKVTNPDGSVRDGASVGDARKAGFDVPAICRALTQ
jgi:hypothetical protein